MIYDDEENNDFEYDYHNIANGADELYEDEYYYDDGSDEPWSDMDEAMENSHPWENYYHNLADDIAED